MATQRDGSDLMDKLNPNGARGICTAPWRAVSSQAIAQGEQQHRDLSRRPVGSWLEHLLLITTSISHQAGRQLSHGQEYDVSTKFLHDMVAVVSTDHRAIIYAAVMERHKTFLPSIHGAEGARSQCDIGDKGHVKKTEAEEVDEEAKEEAKEAKKEEKRALEAAHFQSMLALIDGAPTSDPLCFPLSPFSPSPLSHLSPFPPFPPPPFPPLPKPRT
jgi:hypothetical protein